MTDKALYTCKLHRDDYIHNSNAADTGKAQRNQIFLFGKVAIAEYC